MSGVFESLNRESSIRLGCFVGILAVMAIWELFAPLRDGQGQKPRRWSSNLILAVVNASLSYLVLPIGAAGFAGFCQQLGWGLFNQLDVPAWAAILLSVVLLDLAIYAQHVVFHRVPLLWRLHKVHHSDRDMDSSTGLRFHSIEILLSLAVKLAVVFLLGAPALAVLIFEVVLNGTSMFNHGNVRLPAWLDQLLRLLVVTPDMHRVHHSVIVRETNSNFGFNLPWWDRLFGTYRAQPKLGHREMTIGLPQYRDERGDHVLFLMALPFLATDAAPAGATEVAADAPAGDAPSGVRHDHDEYPFPVDHAA